MKGLGVEGVRGGALRASACRVCSAGVGGCDIGASAMARSWAPILLELRAGRCSTQPRVK